MHVNRRHSRGQVLPMWIVGVIATFSLMIMALNYGNAIRWQIRAQNAADSAAAAVVSIQAQRWNLLMEALYASGVEEYRVRRLLDAVLLTTHASGGCQPDFNKNEAGYASTNAPYCNRTYIDLHDAYQRAVSRYGIDAKYVNDIASLATFPKFQSDAQSLLRTLQDPGCSSATPSPSPTSTGGGNGDNGNGDNGNSNGDNGKGKGKGNGNAQATPAPPAPTPNAGFNKPTCGDYAFKYTFSPVDQPVNGVQGMEYRTGLNNVAADAQIFQFQYGAHNAQVAKDLFDPARVDLVTCAVVPPIIAGIGPFHFKPYYAIGRAAAADIMVEQDWLQPGSVVDHSRPGGDSLFQPAENYTTSGVDPSGGYNWYNVDFAGETGRAFPLFHVFAFPVYYDQFDARTGWWGAMPIKPFGKTVSAATAC